MSESSPPAAPSAPLRHPAEAAALSQCGISSTMPQALPTSATWQPAISLEPCLDRYLARIAAFPIANFAAFSLAVYEIQKTFQKDQSSSQPPGAVDHATDTYQLSTFQEVVPQRIFPRLIAALPTAEEASVVQEPTAPITSDEDFLVKRQEEFFCSSEGPAEETCLFPWVRPLEEISEGTLGEELIWKEELVSQQPEEVSNSSDFQDLIVVSQRQHFQGGDFQTLQLVKDSQKITEHAFDSTDAFSEVSEPLCVEQLKPPLKLIGELSALERAHSYNLEDSGSRAVDKIVETGDVTSKEYLERPLEECIIAVDLSCAKKASSAVLAQHSIKRVRFVPAEVTEVWNDSDRVDSSCDEQSPSTESPDQQAASLRSVSILTDSHIVLPSEDALQFSVLEASAATAETEATEGSLHPFTPEVFECSSTRAAEDNQFGTTENQPSSDVAIEVTSDFTTSATPVNQKSSVSPAVPVEEEDLNVTSEDAQPLSSLESTLAVVDSLKDASLSFSNYPEGTILPGDNEPLTVDEHASFNQPTENQTEKLAEEENFNLSLEFTPEKLVTEVYTSDLCRLLPENFQHFLFDQPPTYSDSELIAPITVTDTLSPTPEYICARSEEIAQVSEQGPSPEQGQAVHNRASEYTLVTILPEELAVISGKEDETPTSELTI
ncbi:unnamed protein product [Schistocephalus solidus]|uniref:Reticulon n=1 Tax=Schistocephalus solidus TaxID=70667 RepID=A0A183TMA2_SCHSO|nr:unnamed protein product [Schistocephalus solidus]